MSGQWRLDRWSRKPRLFAICATLAVVLAGMVSLVVRTRGGSGDASTIDGSDIVVLSVVAAPSLLLVPLTWNWRIWWAESGLAALGWLPMVGPAGDTSCTDCAFVLLIPINLAVVQVGLFVVALIAPRLRSISVSADTSDARHRPAGSPRSDE